VTVLKTLALFFLIAGLLACQPEPLSIQSLKDDDIERPFRVKAGVDTVYHVSSSNVFYYLATDTIGYSVYNKMGFLINEVSKSFIPSYAIGFG